MVPNMIGSFAPTGQPKADLSDRLFNVKVAQFDAVVKAVALEMPDVFVASGHG